MRGQMCAGDSGSDSRFTPHCLDASSRAAKMIIVHRFMQSLVSCTCFPGGSIPPTLGN